jgi:S-DNA-T family DNA segregation ATPase FtsK/SpoIIIE
MTIDAPEHVPGFFEAVGIEDIYAHDFPAVWSGNSYTDEIRFPYGYHRNGDEILPELAYLNLYDLARGGDGPHGGVQGMPGSGKSCFLRALISGLVARYGPDKVALVLADAHRDATFAGMSDLPHTVANISQLRGFPERVQQLVSLLQGEVARREQLLDSSGESDIFAYRAEEQKRVGDPGWSPLPNLLVVIHDCELLLSLNPDLRDQLASIARVGRSLGVQLLIASRGIARLDDAGKPLFGDLVDQMMFKFSLTVTDSRYWRDFLGMDPPGSMVTGGGLHGKALRNPPGECLEVVAFPPGDEIPVGGSFLDAVSQYGALRVMDRWEI